MRRDVRDAGCDLAKSGAVRPNGIDLKRPLAADYPAARKGDLAAVRRPRRNGFHNVRPSRDGSSPAGVQVENVEVDVLPETGYAREGDQGIVRSPSGAELVALRA